MINSNIPCHIFLFTVWFYISCDKIQRSKDYELPYICHNLIDHHFTCLLAMISPSLGQVYIIRHNRGSDISSYSQVLGIMEVVLGGAVLVILPAKGVKFDFFEDGYLVNLVPFPCCRAVLPVTIQETVSRYTCYRTLLSRWFICPLCQFHRLDCYCLIISLDSW